MSMTDEQLDAIVERAARVYPTDGGWNGTEAEDALPVVTEDVPDLVAAAEAVPREQVAIVVRQGEVIVEAYRAGAATARAPLGPDTMRDLATRLLPSAETRVTAATDALAAAERDVTAKREALDARRRTLARLTELAEVPATEAHDTDPTPPTENP